MRIPKKKIKFAEVIVPVVLTESIDPEIVPVVFPKHLNLT
jgi:hypothetical protein